MYVCMHVCVCMYVCLCMCVCVCECMCETERGSAVGTSFPTKPSTCSAKTQIGQTDPSNCYAYILLLLLFFFSQRRLRLDRLIRVIAMHTFYYYY